MLLPLDLMSAMLGSNGPIVAWIMNHEGSPQCLSAACLVFEAQ
jgi:hypothetical protein